MMTRITLVSPEGEEKTLDNIPFIVENHKKHGWTEKQEKPPKQEKTQEVGEDARHGFWSAGRKSRKSKEIDI
jgi:hypothetical protein